MSARMPPALAAALGGLRAQLAASALLRIGLGAVVGLLWTYALLAWGDATDVARQSLSASRTELARLGSLARETRWLQRAEDLAQQRDALLAMAWPATDPGLTEAAFQDAVRAASAKWTLPVRSIERLRTPEGDIATAPRAAGATRAGASAGTGSARLQLRADYKPAAALGLLSELAQGERIVIVDRLALMPIAQPPTIEMDLRIVTHPAARAASAAR